MFWKYKKKRESQYFNLQSPSLRKSPNLKAWIYNIEIIRWMLVYNFLQEVSLNICRECLAIFFSWFFPVYELGLNVWKHQRWVSSFLLLFLKGWPGRLHSSIGSLQRWEWAMLSLPAGLLSASGGTAEMLACGRWGRAAHKEARFHADAFSQIGQ